MMTQMMTLDTRLNPTGRIPAPATTAAAARALVPTAASVHSEGRGGFGRVDRVGPGRLVPEGSFSHKRGSVQ